jgi:hypothetical protein
MQIADGAARKSPELQMHDPFSIGHPNALGMNRQKLTLLHDGTGWYMRHRPHLAFCDFVEHYVRKRTSIHLGDKMFSAPGRVRDKLFLFVP